MKNISFLVLDITLKGGIERFVVNLANQLAIRGYCVKIFSFHKSNSNVMYELNPMVRIKYITNYKFRAFFYKFTTLYSSIKLLRLIKNDLPNSIYISVSPIIVILLCIFKKRLLPSIIASEHSSYFAHELIVRTFRKWSYKKVKEVVTQTNIGKTCFYNDGICAKKIPNFVTVFENSSQWESSDLSDKPFVCLSVARFVEVKQLDHFIEIARIVNEKKIEVIFYLVGSGPLEQSLRDLIKKYKLEHVFYIFSATANIDYFYSCASAYVVTSSSEAFPMTIIEALSFSLPVLSYDQLDGPKEIIINKYNGFLCKQNSPSCVAHKIIELVHSSETMRLLKSNALESARKYHHQALVNDWVEVLK